MALFHIAFQVVFFLADKQMVSLGRNTVVVLVFVRQSSDPWSQLCEQQKILLSALGSD